jgi:hypothetical protein
VSNLGPNGGTGGRGSVEVYDPTLPNPNGVSGPATTGAFDPMRRIDMRGRPIFAAFMTMDATGGAGYRAVLPEQAGPGDAVHIVSSGAVGVAPAALLEISLDSLTCLNAHMMLIDAGGTRAQLICEGDHRGPGSVVWLDLAAGAVLGAVPAGVFPDGLVLVPPLAPTR